MDSGDKENQPCESPRSSGQQGSSHSTRGRKPQHPRRMGPQDWPFLPVLEHVPSLTDPEAQRPSGGDAHLTLFENLI